MKPVFVVVSILAVGGSLAAIGALVRTRTAEAGVAYPTKWFDVDPARTQSYIETLDLDGMQRAGCDFGNPKYDPTRFGYTMEELRDLMDRGVIRDYDFELLAEVERKLDGVDRQEVLRHIFDTVTGDAETNTERHLAILRFLHRVSYHSTYIRPRWPDEQRSRCFDPLILLELNEMHCGHVSRLVQDLWESAGYEARGLGFGAKASAEVYYDDSWHYFDGDSIGGNGMAVQLEDGTIPSWVQLSEEPHLIDLLPHRYELQRSCSPRMTSPLYRSVHCFYDDEGDPRFYGDKTRAAQPGEPNYGWSVTETIRPADWKMYEAPSRYEPGAVRFEQVSIDDDVQPGTRLVRIAWRPSKDRDGDLAGYRVYVGSASRGWNYSRFKGSTKTRPFWSSTTGWQPEMYDALYSLPPGDVGVYTTAEPSVPLTLDPDRAHFITVMPFDQYGESIGKQFYLMSNELRIPASRSAGGA